MRNLKQARTAVVAAAIVGLAWSASKARADSYLFNFSFTSVTAGGVNGYGSLVATQDFDGSYTATSGNGYVYGDASDGFYTGSLSLYANPNSTYASPYGTDNTPANNGWYITYDDVIYPQVPPAAVAGLLVDADGLAFAGAGAGAPDIEIYSSGTYVGDSTPPYLYWKTSDGYNDEPVSFDISEPIAIPATSPVPLPAAAGIGFSLLGGVGCLAALRKRLGRRSRIA
jgi:hypothetical protein